jgi:hypothetical protein
MFDLNVLYVHQADREHRIESDLRRRQALEVLDDAVVREASPSAAKADRRQGFGPVRATGR